MYLHIATSMWRSGDIHVYWIELCVLKISVFFFINTLLNTISYIFKEFEMGTLVVSAIRLTSILLSRPPKIIKIQYRYKKKFLLIEIYQRYIYFFIFLCGSFIVRSTKTHKPEPSIRWDQSLEPVPPS